MNCDVCIGKELNADVVRSGCKDNTFRSVMNSDDCIRKELYAECRIVGGTAVFRGLVERMTRSLGFLKSVSRHFHRHWIHARTSDHGSKVMIAPICFLVVSRSFARVCSARASVFAALVGAPVGTCTASFCGALS